VRKGKEPEELLDVATGQIFLDDEEVARDGAGAHEEANIGMEDGANNRRERRAWARSGLCGYKQGGRKNTTKNNGIRETTNRLSGYNG